MKFVRREKWNIFKRPLNFSLRKWKRYEMMVAEHCWVIDYTGGGAVTLQASRFLCVEVWISTGLPLCIHLWLTICALNSFLSCSDLFYLLIVGADGCFCIWSHSMTHTHTRTLGRTPLDEGSAGRRNLYLTTHNIRQGTDFHASVRIRTRNPSKRAASDPPFKADSRIACRSRAMPCVNSHIPSRAPALLRQCRVLRECPHGSRKYPNC